MTGPPHQPVPWTLDEAASFLRPTVTADQLRRIFAHLPAMNPISRRASTGGRGADEYDMDEVIEWHHLNRRWLIHPAELRRAARRPGLSAVSCHL